MIRRSYGQRARVNLQGKSYTAELRRTRWLLARQIRAQLPVLADRQTVAEQIGVSRQRVEQIELDALYKVAMRMRELCHG